MIFIRIDKNTQLPSKPSLMSNTFTKTKTFPFCIFLVLLLKTFSSWSFNQKTQPDPFDSLDRGMFEVLTPSQCEEEPPNEDLFSQNDLLMKQKSKYEPTGERFNPISNEMCSAQQLEWTLTSQLDQRSLQRKLQDYFKNCHAEAKDPNLISQQALAQINSLHYDPCHHPRIRRINLKTTAGTYLRGFLALQKSPEPRPLVIVKCGVFCNQRASAQKQQLMHLFEESPFHVLAIPNISGVDYSVDNHRISFGGLDEGTELIRIAQQVRSSSLAPFISSVHAQGVSLGSQGVLYASLMNDYVAPQRPLQSALAMCPVVDLKPSIENLFIGETDRLMRDFFSNAKQKLVSHFAVGTFHHHIGRLARLEPLFEKLILDSTHLPDEYLPSFMVQNSLPFYSQREKTHGNWRLPPFEKVSLLTENNFWDANDFIRTSDKWVSQSGQTPTLLLASKDDDVVPTFFNSAQIERSRWFDKANMGVVFTPTGNHCAWSSSYGWDVGSAIHRAFIIANSPELRSLRQVRQVRFPFIDGQKLDKQKNEIHFGQSFHVQAGAPSLEVTFHYFNTSIENYIWNKALHHTRTRSQTIRIPWSSFPNWVPWRNAPLTPSEAKAMTRWLNTHLVIANSRGHALNSAVHDHPALLRWISYDRVSPEFNTYEISDSQARFLLTNHDKFKLQNNNLKSSSPNPVQEAQLDLSR